MDQTQDSTAKNFFLQIGIIASLYTSVASFLTFLFEVIDRVFPANGAYLDYYNTSLRISISTLIVAFPLFIWLSRVYRRSAASSAPNVVRKWLLYFTLFIAGLAMAIDLVIVVNAFLGGEGLAAGFLLKVASILVVAGGIFAFYLKDIRGEWANKENTVKKIAGVVSAVIALSVIGGFFVIGSPSTQRKLARDEQRVNDLSSIQWEIVNFYQSKGAIPNTLAELEDPISGFSVPTDPNDVSYVYRKTGNLTFSLCSTFEVASPEESDSIAMHRTPMNENWNHAEGDHCFERTIDPDRYPLFKR